jgi:hypothetical protein
VKKKLLMKHQNEGLYVPGRKKRSEKRKCYGRRNRADVCRLTNLAGGFVLPVFVRMAYGLRTK